MPQTGSGSWRLNDERTHRVELRACCTANTCQRRPGEADTSLAIKICERLVESPAYSRYRALAISRRKNTDRSRVRVRFVRTFTEVTQVAGYQARSRRRHWSVYGLHMDSKTVLHKT